MTTLPTGPEYNEEEKDTDVASENEQIAQERSPEKLREHLEEIREYLLARQAARPVVKTTQTRLGQELDWIEPESQTPDGRIAEPPSDDGTRDLYARDVPDDNARWPQRLAQFELDDDHEARGPAGTVPVLRRNISEIRPQGTLQDFLSKHGRPTHLMRLTDQIEIPVPADNSSHVYARSDQVATCYGGEGNINVWYPYIQWSDELTLGQLSVTRGIGYLQQTVEAGWQKQPNLYGDWKTHLFIYYTTNGYNYFGDYLGGYNRDVAGWVQVSPTIFPGSLLSVSSFLGPQLDINLKYQLYQGRWWLRVNGNWIGYYPASLFQSFGLLWQADRLAWFGEVADSKNHAGTTGTDMGSGHFPYEGYQKAAYMNKLATQSSADGMVARYNPGYVGSSNFFCYSIEPHFDNTGSWGPYFFWGGTGKNAGCL